MHRVCLQILVDANRKSDAAYGLILVWTILQ